MAKRTLAALIGVFALIATTIGLAPSATAAARNGTCEAGEFCLYFADNSTGSLVDMIHSQRDYGTGSGCITFIGGSQNGTCAKNRAGSAWNRTGKPVYVFYNADYGSTYDVIPNGSKAKLNENVYKDNASHIIGDASLRFPLNVTQAQIKNNSPAWCWNSKTNCHHDYNASDIMIGTGTAVVSPVAGVVKSVNVRDDDPTSVGSSVTIKDSFGRLWYLTHMHHNPAPVVSPGDTVAKGTRIGTVGRTGHAAGTSPHLHIDMRVGVDSRVNCSGSGCAQYDFVNNQPLLRNAFLERP